MHVQLVTVQQHEVLMLRKIATLNLNDGKGRHVVPPYTDIAMYLVECLISISLPQILATVCILNTMLLNI